jgi:hypothetical protein
LDPEHLKTAWGLSNLASVLYDQGDLDHALPYSSAPCRSGRTNWAPTTPTPPEVSTTSPWSYTPGRPPRRRTLHQRALTIREARLGSDHPDTARSLSNLANVLHDQGNPDTARTLHQRALASTRPALDPTTPTPPGASTDLQTSCATRATSRPPASSGPSRSAEHAWAPTTRTPCKAEGPLRQWRRS